MFTVEKIISGHLLRDNRIDKCLRCFYRFVDTALNLMSIKDLLRLSRISRRERALREIVNPFVLEKDFNGRVVHALSDGLEVNDLFRFLELLGHLTVKAPQDRVE